MRIEVEKNLCVLCLLCGYLIVPALAFAAGPSGGATHAPGLDSLFWPAINFCLYAFVINYGYRKVARPMMKSHSVQVQQKLDSSAELLAAARVQLASAKQREECLPAEKEEVLNRIEEDGKNAAIELVAAAEGKAKLIAIDATRQIEGELIKARAECRALVVRRATEVARTHFEKELSEQDDSRLREETVRGL